MSAGYLATARTSQINLTVDKKKKKENNKYEMLQNFSLVATALRNTFLALSTVAGDDCIVRC